MNRESHATHHKQISCWTLRERSTRTTRTDCAAVIRVCNKQFPGWDKAMGNELGSGESASLGDGYGVPIN